MFSIILPPDMVFLGISIFAHISFRAVSVYMPAHCLSNEQKATRKMRVVLMHRPHAPFIFLVRRCQCPASAPPPFAVRGQLPIALALRHPSTLIAIVLRSNKLQIALTQQADDNIYECKKPHIVSPFPAPFFLCAFILSDCQSHKQDCAERKCKKRMRRTCQNPATFKIKKRHPIGCLFSWWR